VSNVEQTLESLHQALKDLSAGLSALPSTITAIPVLETTYSITDLKAKVDGFEKVFATADATHLAAQNAAKARDEIVADVREFMAAAKRSLKGALGKKSPKLEVVGMKPEKTPAPPTVEQKQERAQKAKATRTARHTMGPKQRKAVKGQVPPAQTPPGH
jgi:hypothetical protein